MAAGEVGAELSGREDQIARLYVDGLSYKEIARDLEISPATVRTHLNTIYRKLEVSSRIELLHRLGGNGTVETPPARVKKPSKAKSHSPRRWTISPISAKSPGGWDWRCSIRRCCWWSRSG